LGITSGARTGVAGAAAAVAGAFEGAGDAAATGSGFREHPAANSTRGTTHKKFRTILISPRGRQCKASANV
jgi:hypothetical protein